MGKCVKLMRVGTVGVGKIARDQHIPVLRANSAFELVASASRNTAVDGIANELRRSDHCECDDCDGCGRPFQLLADIFFVGRRSLVEPFEE